MPVHCTAQDRKLTAAIIGEIDHHSAKAIMKELDRQIDLTLPNQLLLDCSGITFMDSSGIAVLLRLFHRMSALGGQMNAFGLPQQAEKVLKAAGLDKLIPITHANG